MGLFTKIFATGIGFVFGGYIGALLGFVLSSLFDGAPAGQKSAENFRTTESDFKMSLLVLMACVMKADGRVLKSELNVVKRFLLANFGESGALEALQILKKLLEQPIDETEVAMQINKYMNYSTKLELTHLMLEIANADGVIVPEELSVIEYIATIFRISPADLASLKAPYFKQTDQNWMYKALEIEPTATNEEVKKAYRRMAMKYHPDKVASAGEEAKKTATEKFRSINEAYEAIKKQRGIN